MRNLSAKRAAGKMERKTYDVPTDPQLYAIMTAELLACAHQLAINNDCSTNHWIEALLSVAAERAKDLADMLEDGEVTNG